MSSHRILSVGRGAIVAAAVLLTPFVPAGVEAQGGGRMQVLVVDLKPADGSQARFGEQAANDLRDRLDLDTHIALTERETDQAARQFNLRRASLDCTTGRQMAQQLSIPLVFCGEYTTEGNQVSYTGSLYTAADEFKAPGGTVAQNRARDAADQLRDFFIETAERVGKIEFCGVQFRSSSWESAVQYCTEAVALSPNSVEARKALGLSYKELERFEEALQQFELILAAEPVNSSILENAGWVATQLGEREKASDYYRRFLQLNPDNALVRISVARELANVDPAAAAELLEAGFEHPSDSTTMVDLHEQFAAIAFRAAFEENERRRPPAPPGAQGGGRPQDGPPPPEVAERFRRALRSWDYVIEHRGPNSRPEYVRNGIAAWLQLQDPDRAIEWGRRGLGFFPRDAQIRRGMAEAFQRRGNIDEAVREMRAALEIDPEIQNARTLMGQWFMGEGQPDSAIVWLTQAAEAGEQTPDALSDILLNQGWNVDIPAGNRARGRQYLTAAAQLPGITPAQLSKVSFLHGYVRYQDAEAAQQPGTAASAQASLPIFQEALRLVRQGEAYARQAGQNFNELLGAVQQYIAVQEAIIQRERR